MQIEKIKEKKLIKPLKEKKLKEIKEINITEVKPNELTRKDFLSQTPRNIARRARYQIMKEHILRRQKNWRNRNKHRFKNYKNNARKKLVEQIKKELGPQEIKKEAQPFTATRKMQLYIKLKEILGGPRFFKVLRNIYAIYKLAHDEYPEVYTELKKAKLTYDKSTAEIILALYKIWDEEEGDKNKPLIKEEEEENINWRT